MKTKDLLLRLVEELALFENNSSDLSFEKFVVHLNQKHTIEVNNLKILPSEVEVKELDQFENNKERDITVLITFMNKYAKNYLKKALENSIINTPDEFAFLITTLKNTSFTKTELINKLVTEKTSGIETIKRLIKKGLLEEFKIIGDKKSVYIKITDFGKNSIFEILPVINKITKIITGTLTENEVQILSNLLIKLDIFHNEIYFSERNSSIDIIYKNKCVVNKVNI